jgi:hypothetical protein
LETAGAEIPSRSPGPDRDDAFFLEREDRFEEFFGGVVHLGHGGEAIRRT